MSSKTLYPPIVDSYMPAFVVNNSNDINSNGCDVYFSLSKFNVSSDFSSVHVSIIDQATGRNVVDTTKYPTGIIINKEFFQDTQDNLYYIKIVNSDLTNGWVADRIYKIQLRLSQVTYTEGEVSAWLHTNSDKFSEWSTVCVIKAIQKINYAIPSLDIDTSNITQSNIIENIHTLYTSTLVLAGSFIRGEDSTELVNMYNFTLYDDQDNVLEYSGDIYTNKYADTDSFSYTFKTELVTGNSYSLAFKFITLNKYTGGFYQTDNEDNRYIFNCIITDGTTCPCELISIENDKQQIEGKIPERDHHTEHYQYSSEDKTLQDLNDSPKWSEEEPTPTGTKLDPWIMKDIIGTSTFAEEEEGRVALKFYTSSDKVENVNLCVRRADSRDNFQTWTDIYLYTVKNESINDIPVFYDYTIESGVWYKYGVQVIETNGDRQKLNIMSEPVMRNFNYSFLLGQDNQQLKLEFDNTMSNFKYQIYDSKVDPIGAKFAHIARNANTYYRIFPINGLISFNMDENNLFCTKKDIYNYNNIVKLYEDYNIAKGISQYDFIYEKDFRNKVLDFLQNGEPKLFKSPTEGNVIIRLTDVNCVPNQTTDRLIYSFSATASEIDEPTMDNYLKHGFYFVKSYESSFAVYSTKIGQLVGPFSTSSDIIKLILAKYGDGNENMAGLSKRVVRVHYMKITFNGKPFKTFANNGEVVIGNSFILNGKKITVLSPNRFYEFDNRLIYNTANTQLSLVADDAETNSQGAIGPTKTEVDATIDFLYDLETDKYEPKKIQTRTMRQGLGQFYQHCLPNENIYNEIYYKYYIDWKDQFLRLNNLSSIIIGANPGATFRIQDEADGEGGYNDHIVGITGLLELMDISNIKGIQYLGITDFNTGILNNNVSTDVMINYIYTTTRGTYKLN